MRTIQINYSINPINPCQFAQEVLRLDNILVNILTPYVISSANAYKNYIRDFNDPLRNLVPPVYSNTKGEKTISIADYIGFTPVPTDMTL